MRNIISLIFFALIIQTASANSLQTVERDVKLPSFCFGVNVKNEKDEIEMSLLDDEMYAVGNGVMMHVGESAQRTGGATISGVVSGVYFAGGGHQAWKMNVSYSRFDISGKLYRYTDAWLGKSTTEYDIICD